MPPEDSIRIRHMIEAARDALEFCEGRSREDLDESKQFQYAVIHAVQIVLEAAYQTSKATRAEHPDIPWAEIVGMRHRVIHAYSETDLDVIWSTARDDFPSLIPALERLLDEG
ncbi:MAG TPA: DUF86 domain-containing protein [Sphingomonas sp.]